MPPSCPSGGRYTSRCTALQWSPQYLWLSPIWWHGWESLGDLLQIPMFLEVLCWWHLPKNLVGPFLDHLNSIEPSIKFTVEKKKDGQLAFLDVQLCREDVGTVSTFVYRNATHTNKYLSFRSHHPMAHKVAVVRTLPGSADNLSSSGMEWAEKRSRSRMHWEATATLLASSASTPPLAEGERKWMDRGQRQPSQCPTSPAFLGPLDVSWTPWKSR